MDDLTAQDSHFAFGENWRDFATTITDERVAWSDQDLARLLSRDDLTGKRVLDIGSGSGLPALSMIRAGAAHVTCVDIDPNSVTATEQTLGRHVPPERWAARVDSVFDLPDAQFDVVHSWGVLHHTGDMWRAIDKAASLVKPGGLLAIAIYCKTPLCGFWTVEKRIYRNLPRPVQAAICALMLGVRAAGKLARFKSPMSLFTGTTGRGMTAWHDQHDWMGGYPYESATPAEIYDYLSAKGFTRQRENLFAGSRSGLFGSACDEYTFRRETYS